MNYGRVLDRLDGCAGGSYGTRDGSRWGCESVFNCGVVEDFHEVGFRSPAAEDLKMRYV